MKKKRTFYNDKKRNQKWTETQVGRKIDFADKYDENGSYSDKYDAKRHDSQNEKKKKQKRQKRIKSVLAVILGVVLISVGYTSMDVHMIRNAQPVENMSVADNDVTGIMADVNINFTSYKVESVSLDSSVMLSSVINDAVNNGFTSITFDVKRSDGTIGYTSSLASVDTFGAISTPASQIEASVKELLANDILPVARICCYKDNVAPALATDSAVMSGAQVYADSDGNTYLNPNSETAYNYIRDIVQECYSYGITVFTLYGCDLPEEISDGYDDGFESISNKLNTDLDGAVKFLEEVDVEINGKDSQSGKTTNSAIKNEIKNFDKIDDSQVYYVSTRLDESRVLEQLNKNNILRFIIEN